MTPKEKKPRPLSTEPDAVADAPRTYERAAGPLTPPGDPQPFWALAIVTIKRMGVAEYNIVGVKIQGDRVLETAVVPESNWDRLEGALRDFNSCATQMYRFKNVEGVLAGKV